MSNYEKVGGGSYGVYRRKEESHWGAWIAVGFVILLIIGAAS